MRYLLVVPGLLCLAHFARAQVGVTICACQPDFYEFTFNFSLACSDRDITPEMPGINDVACRVDPVGDRNVTNKTPVVVTQVQILELGPPPTYDILITTTISAEFGDLSKFNYTSISSQPEKITEANLPAALQLSITGRNANEEEFINYWLIEYDNDCGIWPLLTVGQKIGWTIFSGLGTPSQFICPVAPAESTDFPSDSPSRTPSSVTPVASLPTFKPSFAGPSSSKDAPTSKPSFAGPSSSKDAPTLAPNALCPPVEDHDDAPPRSVKGDQKPTIKGSRSLRVGPHTPVPSQCPEPSSKKSSKKMPSHKKKSKGESSPKSKSKGGASPKAKSKGKHSPKAKSKGKAQPKKKSKGEHSPKTKSKLSPKAKSKGEHSPKKKSKGDSKAKSKGKGSPKSKGKGDHSPKKKGKGDDSGKGASPKQGMQMLPKPPTSGRARRKH